VSKNIKGLVLITGTTSGVGLNTLKPLLRLGWEVIAVNRSNKRAIKIADEYLTKEEVKNVHFIEIDLSDFTCWFSIAKDYFQRVIRASSASGKSFADDLVASRYCKYESSLCATIY